MRITLENAAIGSGIGADVPPISLSIDAGSPVVIDVHGEEQPKLVSMLLGGRLRADSGRVFIDGIQDADALRSSTALVDTPWGSEPPPGVSLRTIVAEEFSFASLPSGRRAVTRFLVSHGIEAYGSLPIRSLPGDDRIRLFSELAVLRRGIGAIVVTSPERHGGDIAHWYAPLAAIADRGVTVAIVTDHATMGALLALGARTATVVSTLPES
jgi:ABC-2 type transport system ATP-binding protein